MGGARRHHRVLGPQKGSGAAERTEAAIVAEETLERVEPTAERTEPAVVVEAAVARVTAVTEVAVALVAEK